MLTKFKWIALAILGLSFFAGTAYATTVLTVPQGGTGIGAYVRGDLIVATSSKQLTRVATSTNGQVLTVVNGFPAWSPATGSGTVATSTLNNFAYYSGATTVTGTPALILSGSDLIASGGLNIGSLDAPVDALDVSGTTSGFKYLTDSVNGDETFVFTGFAVPSVDSLASFYGVFGQITNLTGTNNILAGGALIGLNGQADVGQSGLTTDLAIGVRGIGRMDDGTATNLAGVVGQLSDSAGTMTNGYALWAKAVDTTPGGAGTFTNTYGLKVDPPGIGTKPYTAAVGSGFSYFAGTNNFGSTATTTFTINDIGTLNVTGIATFGPASFSSATATNLYFTTATGTSFNANSATISALTSNSISITGGTINGVVIGGSTTAAAGFTSATATNLYFTNATGTTLNSNSATIGSITINGGSLNGVTIGSSVTAAAGFTSATATNLYFTNATGTSLKANSATISALTSNAVALTGGTIDGITIGNTTPSTGIFSNVTTTNATTTNFYWTGTATGTTLKANSATIGTLTVQSTNNGFIIRTFNAGQNNPSQTFIDQNGKQAEITQDSSGNLIIGSFSSGLQTKIISSNIIRTTVDSNGDWTTSEGAQTSGASVFETYTPANNTGITANTANPKYTFNGGSQTWATSTNIVADSLFTINQKTMNGALGASASVSVNAASLSITGAPICGTNITCNNPLALSIPAGDVSFVGNLAVGTSTMPTVHSTTSTIQLGSPTKAGCLKIRDTGLAAWSYCQMASGVMSCSTTSCE